MYVGSTLDLMYLAIALAVLWCGGFLAWALYELGKLLHQVNATVEDARDKVKRIEGVVMSVKEKFDSLKGLFGMFGMDGGKKMGRK